MSTITTINATDTLADTRPVLNTNFANLNTDKVETLADLGIMTATAATIEKTQYLTNVTEDVQTQLDAAGVIPAGTVLPFAGSSAPTGYLMCYGQAVSRETYATLFGVISTTYGAGNSSTTFNLPDLRGRIVGGLDNLGGSGANRITDSDADTLGGTHGAETHTLTTDEIPSHNHAYLQAVSGGASNENYKFSLSLDTGQGPATYTIMGDSLDFPALQATGGGGAHNNVQPTIFMSYIIKT